MKTNVWRFLALGLLAVTLPAQAITVSVTPAEQTISLGSTVSVGISIDGLGDGIAPSVGTFDIDLGFDPALLSLTNVEFGTQLDVLGLGSIQSFSSAEGSVNLFELSLDSTSDLNAFQAPSFTLATATFSSLGSGLSLLSLNFNALGDALGAPLVASTANGLVTVIPEPSSAALIMMGIVALVLPVALRRQVDAR